MPKIFISYSHQDEAWKDRLAKQFKVLEMEGLLNTWQDRGIQPGDDWLPQIQQALETADAAILLISADFLTSHFIHNQEIPKLLQRREEQGIRVIPLIVSPCPWRKVGWLSALQGATRDNVELTSLNEHEQEAAMSALAERVHDLLQGQTNNGTNNAQSTANIIIDKLPTVLGEFVGREEELQLLTKTLNNPTSHIIQLIAAGGTGKTKLLRHWLDTHKQQLPNRIIWSFYSQGTTDSKQVSLSPLLDAAFKAFKVDQTQYRTEEDKADAFMDLVIKHQCLLVLDGLEPMQHAGRGMAGQLKDKALSRALKRLASQTETNAFCIITTRIAVHDIKDRADVISHPLNNLSTADGIRLLQSHQLKNTPAQLQAVVEKVGGHALTLHLLGNAINTHLYGDSQKLDTLIELVDEYDEYGRHAFKVMQTYADAFRDAQSGQAQPELQLLYLLGLFEHPIEIDVLKVLWQAEIEQLTADIPLKAWNHAIRNLQQKYRLLSQHPQRPDLIDCHPLIREYFGQQLQQQHPSAYQAAHSLLYETYKAIPKQEQPDTVDEMRPLFHAVAHGCAAGKHQQALDEVYWPRIRREQEAYIVKKLGAFSDDLAVVAHFFDTPWRAPAAGLEPLWQAGVLNWAGFRLRALGRMREAMEPMRAAIEMFVKQKNWKQAAINASNLSELQLTLGDLADALQTARQGAEYADQSENLFWRMVTRTTHADALLQTGQLDAALALFQAAEQMQQERQPKYPRLYSLQGFQYCGLLLAQGKTQEVSERALEMIDGEGQDGLLDRGLYRLTLGRAYLQQAQFDLADDWLQQAVDGLRKANYQEYLPLGLLSRAALFRHTEQFDKAQQDLHEVYDIANPSGMRLHLTDYHLESARLGFDRLNQQNDRTLSLSKGQALASTSSANEITCEITAHIQAADQLIRDTGYHRRDAELAQLRQQITHG